MPLPEPSRPVGGGPAGDLTAELLARCRWPERRRVSLAVSGGQDSLALLVLAAAAGLDAVAVHVDHGLRPGGAGEAAVVADAAARFGVGFSARRVDVGAGPNLEARARAARAAALPAGALTGHTADDQAETVLLNLLRGAGLDGLAAMGRRDDHRHPILALRRAETGALCAAVGLTPVVDPTNHDAAAARRNAVRHRLLPLMAEIAGRDPVPVLVRQAALLADDADLLDVVGAGIDPTDGRALTAAPEAVARRALRAWLRSGPEAHPPAAAEIERVLGVARGEAVACEIAGGRRVSRRGGRLRIDLRPPR